MKLWALWCEMILGLFLSYGQYMEFNQWSWCVRGQDCVPVFFGFLDLVLYALNFKMICFSLASVISDYFRLDICDILFFSADWIGNVTRVRASKMPWKGPLFDQLRYRNDIAFQYFRCTQLLAEAILLIISILHIFIYILLYGRTSLIQISL